MTPEMEAAAWEGLATNPAAQLAAEGDDTVARWLTQHDQVAISRERLADLEDRVGYTLAIQRRDDLVAELRKQLEGALRAGDRARKDKATEVRRLTTLILELRRTLTDRDEQIKHLNAEQLNAANRASQHDGEARP